MIYTNESAEMYLENILLLREKNTQIRSIDVAASTGYSKPSVSRAMGLLKKRGYIEINLSGYITLTDEGQELAQKILERHRLLKEFLVFIGVDEETATKDACKIEHDLSDLTFQKIKEHVSRYKN